MWVHCKFPLEPPEFIGAAIVMNLSRHQSLSRVHRRAPSHSSSARQAPAAAPACRALPVWLMFLPWNGCDAGGFYSTGRCCAAYSTACRQVCLQHVLALHRSEGRARQAMPGGIPACSAGRGAPAPGSCSAAGARRLLGPPRAAQPCSVYTTRSLQAQHIDPHSITHLAQLTNMCPPVPCRRRPCRAGKTSCRLSRATA